MSYHNTVHKGRNKCKIMHPYIETKCKTKNINRRQELTVDVVGAALERPMDTKPNWGAYTGYICIPNLTLDTTSIPRGILNFTVGENTQ